MKNVSNEKAIYELAKALNDLADACPDVGIGLSFDYYIDQAIMKLGLTKSDVDMKKLK